MAIRYLPKSEELTDLIRQEQDLNNQYLTEKNRLLNIFQKIKILLNMKLALSKIK